MSNERVHYPPQTVVVYTQTAWSRFWSWLGWFGFIITGLVALGLLVARADYFDTTSGIEEKYVSGEKMADDKIAIITVSGVIMDGEGFVKNQIDKVRQDKKVKAIVLRVDSPGGTVSGSDYIFHHLKKLRDDKAIPLVVSMGGIAASGGYYVSMAVGDKPDTIYAEPTCTTGSIGVMIPHYDISGLMKEFGVKDDSLATHPRKLMLSMTREMTDDERKLAQSHITDMFDRFKAVVKEGRPHFKDNPADLDTVATGEIFTAEKALAHKLIDKIDFQEAAIDRALELASLRKEKTKIVKFKKPVTLSDSLLSTRAPRGAGASAFDLAALLDLAAPRAWYLASSLPAILSSQRADQQTMRFVLAFIQPTKLKAVQEALAKIGVERMTVCDALGYAQQRGGQSQPGPELAQPKLLRKVALEIGVNEDFLDKTVATIARVARSGPSGAIGDGKIFVMPIEEVVRISDDIRGPEAIS